MISTTLNLMISTTLKLKKETKGTVVYASSADDDSPPVPTLYIRKDSMKKPYPDSIRLSIEVL